MANFKDNYDYISGKVRLAEEKAGRKPGFVRLMAVSKTRSVDEIMEAYDYGVRLFGENRIQEAAEKKASFGDEAELHIIGHLQSNKAKKAVEIASCVQSVDRIKIARMLNRFSAEAGKILDVYLEFNTSGEESKSGFRSETDLYRAVDEILSMENLNIKGMMTIGPLSSDEGEIRGAFRHLKNISETLKSRYPEKRMDCLSMGMSGDFEVAIEEGSTLVRVGTALFGARKYK